MIKFGTSESKPQTTDEIRRQVAPYRRGEYAGFVEIIDDLCERLDAARVDREQYALRLDPLNHPVANASRLNDYLTKGWIVVREIGDVLLLERAVGAHTETGRA